MLNKYYDIFFNRVSGLFENTKLLIVKTDNLSKKEVLEKV